MTRPGPWQWMPVSIEPGGEEPAVRPREVPGGRSGDEQASCGSGQVRRVPPEWGVSRAGWLGTALPTAAALPRVSDARDGSVLALQRAAAANAPLKSTELMK